MPASSRRGKAQGRLPYWIVCGDDGLRIERHLAEVVAQAGGKGVLRQTFWAPEKGKGPPRRWTEEERQRVETAIRSRSFFSPQTLVIVKGADRLHDEDVDLVRKALEACNERAAVVFVCENDSTSRRIEKTLGKPVAILPASSPKNTNEAIGEITALARTLGHKIDREAAELLLELVGANLLELKNQLEKLSVVVGPGKTIGRDQVDFLVGNSRARNVWELVDAIGRRDAKQALELAARMVEDGQQFPMVVGAIASAFRRAWLAKEEREGSGGRPAGYGAVYHDAKRAEAFSHEELAAAIEALAEIDLAFKRGVGKERRLLEEFVLRMCRLPAAG